MSKGGIGVVPMSMVIATAFVCTVLMYFTFYAAPREAQVAQSRRII